VLSIGLFGTNTVFTVVDWEGDDGATAVPALRFFQVTRADNHSLKFHYMRRFADFINMTLQRRTHFIELVVVRPVTAGSKVFTWTNIVGMPRTEKCQSHEKRIVMTEVLFDAEL
jgi:hypothetical protein